MKLISGVIFIIAALALSNASGVTTLKRISIDQLLLKTLMESKSNDYVAECFNLYTPMLNAILDEFNESYVKCGTDAQAAKTVLSEEAAANRTLITESSESVCQSMSKCTDEEDALAFFDCFVSVGGENVKTVYSLSGNAQIVAADLREQYMVIEASRLKCQNASERAYLESFDSINGALNTCLINGPPEIVTTTGIPESPTEANEQSVGEFEAIQEAQFEEEDLGGSVKAIPKIPHKQVKVGRIQRGSN